MSYLHLPRIIFTGDFLSDVSTINNDVSHYNNETFRPSFQEPGPSGTNGWWNPEGGATFDFKNCEVQKISYLDGTVADSSNIQDLIGEFIQGAEGRSSGKMVDLDPQQQMVSQLWAVRLRIINKAGDEVLSGDMVPTGFRDLQMRQTDGGKLNGQPLGASWTTVLENIQWGDTADNYAILKELKATTHDNTLSLNLNGFGYYYSHAKDGRFSLGRIIGAIGPWFKGEPKRFTSERRLFATKQFKTPSPFKSFFSLSNFRFNTESNILSIDFGNSMPISNSLGDVTIKNKYVLAVSNYPLNNAPDNADFPIETREFTLIGDLSYSQGDWIMKTGGIVDMKISQELTDQLKNNQLILLKEVDNSYFLIARESWNGLNVRADQMVQRIDTDEAPVVDIYANQWGNPLPNGSIGVQLAAPTPSQPGGICPTPGINHPADGLTLNSSNIEIENGKAQLTITGNKIYTPRVYLDGQIYHVLYQLLNSPTDYANVASDFISVHLRDYFPVPAKPKWTDIQETMQQFSNLYPIMSKYLVDLGDRQAVLDRKKIMLFAFSQDINSPMHMPVTRDLSEGKRLTIVAWLNSDGKWDNTTESGPSSLAAHAIKAMDDAAKQLSLEPSDIPEVPSDFHQKLMAQMKMKMGEGLSFTAIEDLTKL